MTSPANSAPVAAVWGRRLAVLLAVAATLVTVRGLMCTDGMLTHVPSVSASVPTSMEPSDPAAWSPSPASGGASDGGATTPPWWCPALTTATSTADPVSCLQPSATAAANPDRCGRAGRRP